MFTLARKFFANCGIPNIFARIVAYHTITSTTDLCYHAEAHTFCTCYNPSILSKIQLVIQLPKLLLPRSLLAAKIWTWTTFGHQNQSTPRTTFGKVGPLLAAITGPGGQVLARNTFRMTHQCLGYFSSV